MKVFVLLATTMLSIASVGFSDAPATAGFGGIFVTDVPFNDSCCQRPTSCYSVNPLVKACGCPAGSMEQKIQIDVWSTQPNPNNGCYCRYTRIQTVCYVTPK